jgi:methylated-DNA-protein-cysteine methyltransferase-like protein
MRAEAHELIWRTVVAIPRGEIATYGGIARRAGLPGGARMVGHALKVAPRGLALPWHRVVAAGGRIAFPKGSRQYAEQARRLRAEGVDVVCGRVLAGAEPDLDELLWKPK